MKQHFAIFFANFVLWHGDRPTTLKMLNIFHINTINSRQLLLKVVPYAFCFRRWRSRWGMGQSLAPEMAKELNLTVHP